MAEQGAAPAPCASQARVPGGAGDPPGGTTTPRDWLADGMALKRQTKSAAPVLKTAAVERRKASALPYWARRRKAWT
jgi:hypothetical protein